MKNNLRQIKDIFSLNAHQLNSIDKIIEIYPMLISDYYLSLAKSSSSIYKQCIPNVLELNNDNFLVDPLAENKHSPLNNLIHKYPNRALILTTNKCFTYCRHCTRKRFVGKKNHFLHNFNEILVYLRQHDEITDVLISGGDPFTLSDNMIDKILKDLRTIPHISTIRIGTRAIVTNPQRITDNLARILEKYHPIWINTQFNHSDEITETSTRACEILLRRGIPIGNQTVLLKGINDNFEILKNLFLSLINIRVRPYYLYQCDAVKGTMHFRVNLENGIKIMTQLRKNLPGYAVPNFIVENDIGKIMIEENRIIKKNGKIYIKTYDDELIEYI